MDILQVKWNATGTNVQCPQIRISARFADSNDHRVTLSDLRESAGKSILFPNIVSQLTAGERQELMEAIVQALLQIYRGRIED